MADRMLGKVVAGAALGGAALVGFTPAMAYAGGQHEDDGTVIARPDAVKPGDAVKLLEICPSPQEHAFVWSKITGRVQLQPARDDHGDVEDWNEAGQEADADQKSRDDESSNGYHGTPKPPEPDPWPTETATADADLVDPSGGEGGGTSEGSDADPGPDATLRHADYGTEDEGAADLGPQGRDAQSMADENGLGERKDGVEPPKDFVYHGEVQVPTGTEPGTYELKGTCGDGKLVVAPTGAVAGGDGGMTTTSTDLGMAAGGAGVLGAAALGGIVLLRRRRADGRG